MSRHAAGPAHDMSADPLLLSLAQAARARERWRSGTVRTCARRGCPCSPLRSSLRRIPPRLLLPARRNKRQPRGQSWFGSVNVSTSRAPPCSAHSGAAGPGAVPLLSVLTRSRMAPPGMVLLLLLAGRTSSPPDPGAAVAPGAPAADRLPRRYATPGTSSKLFKQRENGPNRNQTLSGCARTVRAARSAAQRDLSRG